MKIKILYNICYLFSKKCRQPVQLKMSKIKVVYTVYLSVDMIGKNAKLLKTLSY